MRYLTILLLTLSLFVFAACPDRGASSDAAAPETNAPPASEIDEANALESADAVIEDIENLE